MMAIREITRNLWKSGSIVACAASGTGRGGDEEYGEPGPDAGCCRSRRVLVNSARLSTMEDDYYDIDAILVENQVKSGPLKCLQRVIFIQKIQCTFKHEVPSLGYLDGGSEPDVHGCVRSPTAIADAKTDKGSGSITTAILASRTTTPADVCLAIMN